MQIATLYLATAVTFLVLDALMLSLVMKPLFQRHIGALMLDGLRLGPAVAFYLFYVGAILWFAGWPALRDGGSPLLSAAILGAAAYGTYEFTSYAIMRDWHWSMVAADVTWGTVLTAVSAAVGVAVVRGLFPGAAAG
jgi:uncharacterized membrane protein